MKKTYMLQATKFIVKDSIYSETPSLLIDILFKFH
jgi:hypothetical protein